MTAPPPSATETTGTLGHRFVLALAAKDGARMKALVHPSVDFRAVTPGRCWEAAGAEAVVDGVFLGTWFATERRITALDGFESQRIGAMERIRYRLELELPDGRCLVEQQAYLRCGHGQITSMWLVCSGFVSW